MSEPKFDPKDLARLIREGRPFEDIFPRMPHVTPAPRNKGVVDNEATFVAQTMDSPHRGTPIRSYLLDCAHATQQLSLPDMPADRDGEVLGNMLRTLQRHSGCDCEPKGWSRA